MWNKIKENTVSIIKLWLLICMMINGFFITYAFIWFKVGLPLTNWALFLLFALACLSEGGYLSWAMKIEEGGAE